MYKQLSLVLVVLIAGIFTFNLSESKNQACFEKNCFDIKIADNGEERQSGLMEVSSLDSNKGMLFIFPEESIHPFWMKNMLIPLDIIWIDGNYEVVFIAKNQQPCAEIETCTSIIPESEAKYVLEINSWLVDELEIKIGDKIYLS
ncbi:MAG: DUF192 domain-containing protein [Candidatus Pacearchaeota archaeon]